MTGQVDALVVAASMPLGEAAAYLASCGVPVFPCAAGGKSPLVARGYLSATTDAQQVRRWWQRWPEANIGVPTGQRSGVDVVDVDVRAGGQGYPAFYQAVARLDATAWAVRVATPSGGMHVYYPCDPARPGRSWACATAHVDFRGTGGYIIVPPSSGMCDHDLTSRYTVIDTRDTARPIDAGALRDLLDPAQARRRFTARLSRATTSQARATALRAWVADRSQGERNTGLFWAACRMTEAGHTAHDTLTALGPPALYAGLTEREVRATIASAVRHTQPASPTTPAGVTQRQTPSPLTPPRPSARPVMELVR